MYAFASSAAKPRSRNKPGGYPRTDLIDAESHATDTLHLRPPTRIIMRCGRLSNMGSALKVWGPFSPEFLEQSRASPSTLQIQEEFQQPD